MDKDKLRKEIENVFRCSGSPDELFDAFREAIHYKIKDGDLYEILLWNKALSPDEIKMYASKICNEFPGLSFRINFDTGKILEAVSSGGNTLEPALYYYQKAAEADPASFLPYVAAAELYNLEFNLPKLDAVVEFLVRGIDSAEVKSKICYALVSLYRKTGNTDKERYFQKLGEKYQRDGK